MTSAKIMHAPQPGPLYWDFRCLTCGEAVNQHASLLQRLINRITEARK